MKKWLLLCAALVLVAPCGHGIEVPLEYVKTPEVKSAQACVSAVRVATTDLSTDASAAPYVFDLQTSTAKGLARFSDLKTSVAQQYGREASSPSIALIFDDDALRTGKRDLWVAVDYYDPPDTSGALALLVRYAWKDGGERQRYETGAEFTGSGTWKQHVFHLKNLTLAAKPSGSSDLSVMAYQVYPFSMYGYGFLQGESNPGGEYKMPKLVAKHPAYAKHALLGKDRLVVLDKLKPDDKFYSRLYYDANGNGDLTDDKVMETSPTVETYRASASFGVLDLLLEQDGKTYPFAMQMTCDHYGPITDEGKMVEERRLMLRFRTAAHYAGSFEQDGKTYYLAVGDENCNGTFNEKPTTIENYVGDTVYFKADHLALATSPRMKEATEFLLGDQLMIGKSLYDVSVDVPNRKLTLTPVSGVKGTLNLSQPARTLQLTTNDNKSIMCVDAGDSLNLPPGDYGLYEYTMDKEEPGGAKWRISARATSITSGTKVAAGSEAKLAFGEPFRPTIGIPAWEKSNLRNYSSSSAPAQSSGGVMSWFFGTKSSAPRSIKRPVNLDMHLKGAGGELVTNLALIEGDTKIELADSGSAPKEPTYVITKPDGELVAKGNFEYG